MKPIPTNEERNASIRELTDTIEARKEQKQRQRLEKQRAEAEKKRRLLQERLVAPILLVITILISAFLMMLNN